MKPGTVADRLESLLSDLSESAYAARWMHETEFEVWRLGTEGGRWGFLKIPDERVGQAMAIAQEHSQWVYWDDSAPYGQNVRTIDLGDWFIRYEAWRKKWVDRP